MQLLDKLSVILLGENKAKLSREVLNSMLYIYIYSIVIFLVGSAYSILALVSNDIPIFAILLTSLFLFVANFVYLIITSKYKLSALFVVLIYSITILASFLFTDYGLHVMAWCVIYPVVSMFLLGKMRGSIAVGSFLILMFLIFFTKDNDAHVNSNILIFLTLFVVTYVVAYIYIHIKEKYVAFLENSVVTKEKILNEKTNYIAKLSRQIRGPLGNIVGITNILSETNLDNIQDDFLKTIQASAGNIANVLSEIGDDANFGIDLGKPERHNFNLYNLLINAINQIKETIGNCNCNINVSDDIPSMLTGVPSNLKHILESLIKNYLVALQNHPSEIRFNLNVTVSVETDYLLVCLFELKANAPVRLSGDVEEILYKSSDDETIKIKELIENLGGKIKISSDTIGQFYSFTLSFKKNEKEAKTEDAPKEKDETTLPENGQYKVPKAKVDLKDANVLLVEDNLINQKIMILSLKKIVKNIDVANNGREALDRFGKTIYDIILMDIQMPVLDGIKTTIKLRAIEQSTKTHVPVIAITANALTGDKETCIEAGMDDYLSKPFKVEMLIRKMNEALLKKI